MEKTYQNQTQPKNYEGQYHLWKSVKVCESLWKFVKTFSTTPILFKRLHDNDVLIFWEVLVQVKWLLAKHWQPLPWPRLIWCNLVNEDEHIGADIIIITSNTPFLKTVFKRNTHPHPIIYNGAKGQRCFGLNGLHQQWRKTFYSGDLEGFIALAHSCILLLPPLSQILLKTQIKTPQNYN